MTTTKPLAGRRIVVTRAPERSQELIRDLEAHGAEVLMLPTVGTTEPLDPRPLNDALRHLEDFDAILFVSRTAVEETCKRAEMIGKREVMRELPGRLIAAVGPATARAAAQKGIVVDYIASEHTGESLVRELRGPLAGRNVFLPRSERGDKRLLEALRGVCVNVTAVVAYRTVTPEPLDPELISRVRRGDVDMMIFASPSAFDNLSETIGVSELAELSARVQFAAIGPTTAAAIRKRGSRVYIVAREPSSEGLTAAIVQYYENAEFGLKEARREK